MRKIIACILSIFSVSFAFVDSDLDGVDDAVDKCPNTPFNQLVGPDGCPLGKVGQERVSGPKGTFYFRVGGGFSKDKSYSSTYSSVSLAYAFKGLYLSWTSYYYFQNDFANEEGLGNSFLYGSYSKFFGKLYTTAGLNVKIPTGQGRLSDDNFDFTPSLTLDYIRGKDDYFVYYGYTIKGKSGLKDVHSVSLGAGYQFSKKFYSSLSLDALSSAVSGKMRYYLTYFGIYNFSKKYYSTFSYSYGINERATDHSVYAKLGIRF
ncbi:hypothetical protein SAMN06265182_1579 [Persephonella hydrogeniphila]|uniref:Outer membrane protein beta-barrel domain-containing protein n=1 Tax=Persephonella hydrogeniphila TaxID=198703 RepID=A0A285NKW8_9AQUI|nr:hypothetical protein [Persephonella hydrogeniphila]SNZ09597.1 hypothetical protein SAMN06265182_1579 [Persephonella hydrogeniphila]